MTARTIEETIRSSNRAFSALDPDAMARHFHVPLLVLWSDAKISTLTSQPAIRGFADEIVASMQQQNLLRSNVLELHAREIGPVYGIASWSFERIAHDGSSLGRLSATYALVRTETSSWAIAMIMVHSFETLLRL